MSPDVGIPAPRRWEPQTAGIARCKAAAVISANPPSRGLHINSPRRDCARGPRPELKARKPGLRDGSRDGLHAIGE